MKKKIHPEYVNCEITCLCGNVIHTRSTKAQIHVEVCSKCHPFFTGKQRFVDTAGRVEKFQRRYNWNRQRAADAPAEEASAAEAAEPAAEQASETPES